ncbi:MAG: hypothetical protein DMG79_03240 [Acidobacteria bacterium]|nr:MAG: hypothetical protein DMG79_03240 [Acidobacteriota bacterium]
MRLKLVTMKTSLVFTTRPFLLRLAWAATIILVFALLSRAGGPQFIAGTAFFDPSTTGQPLVWPQGLVTYYTDQGDLSPLLPNASANSLVADAFSQWTSVPTAALAVSSGGQLAEDVNGTNVIVNSGGTISIPADIQSIATGTPVGIVYDVDGSVTDALIGAGAGDSSECFSNAVFGGIDNYGSSAIFQHALIVINGQCAQQSSQLTDVEYRLVRVIGRVLGLGWSQVNPNVHTRNPPPTADDYAGFPVMHSTDPLNCIPITICYANPYLLAMDDIASISRLYPVTTQNLSQFPGKQVFSTTTARIHGSVWFSDTHGNSAQAMQGVNVVARWIDSTTGLPSRRYAAAAVSGFLFTGNQGNPITGYDDALGDPLAQWGSNSQTLEGFFDLAGLQPPDNSSTQYLLTVEALDPTWSANVGPYSPGPVALSGWEQPIIVSVSAGDDVAQDIVMSNTAQALPQAVSTWSVPAIMPLGGDWESSLNGYGDVSYFLLPAQANRTLSVAVTALDETGAASLNKTQPVIGMWAASDPEGTMPPAFTPAPFNQIPFGLTRLDASVGSSTDFLIGISDVRGDGRPDYRYHAYVLYADSVSPSRISVRGGPVTVLGTGFHAGLSATIGGAGSTPLEINAGQMILAAPAKGDGTQDIAITDSASGGSSIMTAVLTYGAAASDNIILLSGGLNPQTPVGTQATNPVIVRVLAADGTTPVSGATIGWSASNSLQLSACSGASSCTATTDQSGYASSWLTPAIAGVATATATLAPGVYSPAKSVSATLSATESASEIGVLTQYLWISQDASVSIPLTARVLSNGVPQGNGTVNFTIVHGSGTLSAASAPTNSSGYATLILTVAQIEALVQVSACVAPANAPCQPFFVNTVPLSQQNLRAVSGAGQVSTGQAFQPIVVQVVDSASIADPVIAAPVTFLTTVLRSGGTSSTGGGGEINSGNPAMPVILKVSQSIVATDINGIATTSPSADGFGAPVEVDVFTTAGITAWLDDPLQLLPGTGPTKVTAPSGAIPVRVERPVAIREKE